VHLVAASAPLDDEAVRMVTVVIINQCPAGGLVHDANYPTFLQKTQAVTEERALLMMPVVNWPNG